MFSDFANVRDLSIAVEFEVEYASYKSVESMLFKAINMKLEKASKTSNKINISNTFFIRPM